MPQSEPLWESRCVKDVLTYLPSAGTLTRQLMVQEKRQVSRHGKVPSPVQSPSFCWSSGARAPVVGEEPVRRPGMSMVSAFVCLPSDGSLPWQLLWGHTKYDAGEV